MAAGKYSFVIEQGTTTNFNILYQDSSKNYIDLTGYAARMQLRPNISSPTVYLQLSSSRNSDGTGITVSPSGSINIYIASCTSSMLTFDQAVYDLEIYSGSGACPYVIRLLEGNVKLSKEVTR
jgi:hypothetical protein